MPMFAHVAAPVPCLRCGADLTAGWRVAFQWGYCDRGWASNSDASTYRIGDELLWRADAKGGVPVWRYFSDGTGNIGDPRIKHLLVRDSEMGGRLACPSCQASAEAAGVFIRDGAILQVRAFAEWPASSEVCEITDAGELIPRPEWDDRPMPWPLASGSPRTLIRHADARTLAVER